jgi:hypothetical protein
MTKAKDRTTRTTRTTKQSLEPVELRSRLKIAQVAIGTVNCEALYFNYLLKYAGCAAGQIRIKEVTPQKRSFWDLECPRRPRAPEKAIVVKVFLQSYFEFCSNVFCTLCNTIS